MGFEPKRITPNGLSPCRRCPTKSAAYYQEVFTDVLAAKASYVWPRMNKDGPYLLLIRARGANALELAIVRIVARPGHKKVGSNGKNRPPNVPQQSANQAMHAR